MWGLATAVRWQEGTCIGMISKGDLDNAQAYTQQTPDYNAWVGSWYGYRKYWYNGKPTGSPMPDWNRYKY